MKIVIVNDADLNEVPPIRNLLDILIDLRHEIVLLSRDKENALDEYKMKGVKTYLLREHPDNILGKAISLLKRRRNIREIIEKEMGDLLWAASDKSAIDIGVNILKKYKSVVQLLELTKDIPLYTGQNFIRAHLVKYAKAAWKIVVPEYNRAHILKIWWDLRELPVVLPNKPYRLPPRNIPDEIKLKLNKLIQEKRKVLLYQGIFARDRDLETVSTAVDKIQNYVLYIMGRENEYLYNLIRDRKNIEYISYIKPPYHIYAARYADIGLLPYKPTKSVENYSELNSLYCAPNKIYEYASQGLPMIGPDIPGLKFPFELNKIGICYRADEPVSVIEAVHNIEKDIETYKTNCQKFWNLENVVDIINSIINNTRSE